MNDAHLHLLVNHFPIIGLFFGSAILLFGIIKKNTVLITTAYVIFIFCTVMGKVSMFTGEKAEEIIENLGISRELIHEHEEHAENYIKVMYLLAIAAIVGLYAGYKKHPKALLFSYLVMIISVVAMLLSANVGISGGEIRHTEISELPAKSNSTH